ncbi:MAG: hypothetical protein AAGA08_16125 [Pseudomonadota bacterium]
MKITRHTPEHLIISENPIWIAVLLVFMGLVFLGFGLGLIFTGEWLGLFPVVMSLMPFGFLFIFVRRVQVIFNGPEGTLTVQRKNLHRAFTVVHDLADVSEADLETSRGDKGAVHRVTLVLTGESAGRHPITQAYSNVGNHRGAADAINQWLAAHRAKQVNTP